MRRIGLWFLVSGSVGLAIALILTALISWYSPPSLMTLVLWPTSVAGMADPGPLLDKLLVAAFEFGGQFFLYGLLGMLVGVAKAIIRGDI
jgi:hypothetical protein